jgi:hypothetical protein
MSHHAMTKAQHDVIMATRSRAITDGPMRPRPRDMTPMAPDTADVIDQVVGRIGTAEIARFRASRIARTYGAFNKEGDK